MVVSSKWRIVLDALVTLVGILIFAFFVGASFPMVLFAILGLVISGLQMVRQFTSLATVWEKFGINFQRSTLVYLIIGVEAGVLIGLFYRWHLSVPIIPAKFTTFAFVAAAIGASEELIFRGYLQGRLYKVNVWLAVVFGSLGHTLYKALLFLSPFALHDVDVQFLVIWTFGVGLFFGWLTKVSKSVIPALLAHALFDIWVYGQLSQAPWWVW